MERDPPRSNNNSNGTANNKVDISGRSGSGGAEGSLLLRSSCDATRQAAAAAAAPSDFLLQWGNRKRLRCMKVQGRDKNDPTAPAHRTTARIDRRVVRADKDSPNRTTITHSPAAAAANHNSSSNGYLNLRQRGSSPQLPPPHQRILRNSETTGAMRGHGNGGVRGIASPDRGAHDRRGNNNHHHHHHSNNNNNNNHHHNDNNNKSAATSDTAHDSKKGGSSSGGSGEAGLPQVWPPKFAIALTNKEKEEDFLVIKGSKLPQRPKKRAKIIQRTVNLVSPGAWLSDLTLERYEVREKKISKKRPRGLKAMGNMESDSE